MITRSARKKKQIIIVKEKVTFCKFELQTLQTETMRKAWRHVRGISILTSGLKGQMIENRLTSFSPRFFFKPLTDSIKLFTQSMSDSFRLFSVLMVVLASSSSSDNEWIFWDCENKISCVSYLESNWVTDQGSVMLSAALPLTCCSHVELLSCSSVLRATSCSSALTISWNKWSRNQSCVSTDTDEALTNQFNVLYLLLVLLSQQLVISLGLYV